MKIIHLENDDLESLIRDSVVLIDFYADWCGPCKMIAPVLERIQDQVQIIKINIDNHESLASKYGVMSIPTLIFTKDGKEVRRLIGYTDEDELKTVVDELR